jgi:hypothetical protein
LKPRGFYPSRTAGKKLTIAWNEIPKGNDSGKMLPTKFESDVDMNLFVCEKLSGGVEKPKE